MVKNINDVYLGEFYNYARVSDTDQNVKQQSKHNRDWSKRMDLELVGAVLDKESGRKPLIERKAFRKLLNKALREKRGILVQDYDRLTRNWDDVTFIERHFRENWDVCKLVATNFTLDLSTPVGRYMFRSYMAQACFMPENMRERQKIGITRAQKEGKYQGRKAGSLNKDFYRRNRNGKK